MNANENNNALHEEAVHEIPAVPSASSDDEGNGHVDVNVNAGGDSKKNGVREQQHVRDINNNVQETNTYHTSNNAQMFHHQNPPNNGIMYANNNNNNNGPQFQPPAYGCYGPPSMANNMASFPYAAQPHNSLPPNLPQILAPPPTLPIPPPTLNDHNNVGLDAQRQYYEAQMRE